MEWSVYAVFGLSAYAYMMYAQLLFGLFLGRYLDAVPTCLLWAFPWNDIDGHHPLQAKDTAPPVSPQSVSAAVVGNLVLVFIFAVQHSAMARQCFKEWVTRWCYDERIERSVYVMVASAVVHALVALWEPIKTEVPWRVDPGTIVGAVCYWMPLVGFVIVMYASSLIDGLALTGVRQSCGMKQREQRFTIKSLYRYCRHPIMVGFFLSLWGNVGTMGHLLLAVSMSAYIVLAVVMWEEPDLVDSIGEEYVEYQSRVGMFFPKIGCPFLSNDRKNSEKHA